MRQATSPRWFAAGDINGFFGLVVDNLSILGFLATALVGIFGFPAEFVFTHMFPGTALMYLIGTDGIHRLRRELAARPGFELGAFHDRLLSYGSIPVALAAEAMRA